MQVDEKVLGELLIDAGLISSADWSLAQSTASDRGVSIDRVLTSRGHLSSDDLRRVYSYALGIPFINLSHDQFDFPTLSLIPEPVTRAHNIIAFKRDGDDIEIAALEIQDLSEANFLKDQGLRISPHLTDEDSIRRALVYYQKALQAEFGDTIRKEAHKLKAHPTHLQPHEPTEKELDELANNASLGKVLDSIIKHALAQGASAIHLERAENGLLVRYRIHNALRESMILPLHIAYGIGARLKTLSGLRLWTHLPQAGQFKVSIEGDVSLIKLSTMPTSQGEKLVLSIVRRDSSGFILEDLGFGHEDAEVINRVLSSREGSILISGPKGSGKTTTAYTMLSTLNNPRISISTVEDHVAHLLSRVSQTELTQQTGLTTGEHLRAILRQDPDVIMFDSSLDREALDLLLAAGTTGKLTIFTLEARSLEDARKKLMKMGASSVLASSLKIVISTRLVRRLGINKSRHFLTKTEILKLNKRVPTDKILELLRREGVARPKDTLAKISFWKPWTGTKLSTQEDGGKIALVEVFYTSTETMRQTSMIEDALVKAAQGLISIDEVLLMLQ